MLPQSIQTNLNQIKSRSLILDIETSSHYPDGREINIRTSFDDYVFYSKVKWFGCYSYKNNQQYYLNAITQSREILNLLNTHDVIVGFNSMEFDFPILVNNGLTNTEKRYTQVDLMQIMGTMSQKNKMGYALKGKGELMGYKFKNNSLKCMAETMKLEHQKGDIDYKVFHKNNWTEEETKEIKKYLYNDVMISKQIFDKLWWYWLPFAELLSEKFIYDLSWIRSSIASLTYKAACKVLDVEPTYAEKKLVTEEMGGNVLVPKYEEANDVWYIDFASLYPHIFSMFNLPAEINEENKSDYEKVWHGNKIFQVKGYYNISKHHILSKYIAEKLKERIELQRKDPTSSMIYTLKILLNGLYGCFRSPIFEKIHTSNCGWDCCWLGQQIQDFTKEMMESFGFETIYGDTDSLLFIIQDKSNNNKEYVQECLNQIIEIIKDNVPFPVDTFNIKIEHYLDYIMFPFSDQPVIDEVTGENKKIKNRLVRERKGKKKNYAYIYQEDNETKVKLVGLPLIKDNATPLGIQIYNEVLEKEIIKNKRAKFTKEYIDNIINDYLKRKEVIESLAVEYKVNKADSYKTPNQIQAQISKAYFAGESGTIRLIKNNKVGKVGKGTLYCTIEEAYENKLTSNEFDLEKIYNELDPFIIYEEKKEEFWVRNTETNIEYLVNLDEYEANRVYLKELSRRAKRKLKN